MNRLNYLPRRKESKTPVESTEHRVDRAIAMIRAKGEISTFNLYKIMQGGPGRWGPGIHQSIILIIKDNYQDEVEWNKKTRMLKYVGKYTSEQIAITETIKKETPKLSSDELKIINAIKQESR